MQKATRGPGHIGCLLLLEPGPSLKPTSVGPSDSHPLLHLLRVKHGGADGAEASRAVTAQSLTAARSVLPSLNLPFTFHLLTSIH